MDKERYLSLIENKVTGSIVVYIDSFFCILGIMNVIQRYNLTGFDFSAGV